MDISLLREIERQITLDEELANEVELERDLLMDAIAELVDVIDRLTAAIDKAQAEMLVNEAAVIADKYRLLSDPPPTAADLTEVGIEPGNLLEQFHCD